jgi:predicted nucleic acid-binding protein
VILDTHALSAFLDGDQNVGARLSGESRVAIPVIVLGEFRYGIQGSRRRAAYERWLDDYLPDFEILPVSEATAVVYAQVRAALKKAGRPIPANDAWIAAIALQHRMSILSRDEHFDAVAGVRREGW